jgi:hypothetical protein
LLGPQQTTDLEIHQTNEPCFFGDFELDLGIRELSADGGNAATPNSLDVATTQSLAMLNQK